MEQAAGKGSFTQVIPDLNGRGKMKLAGDFDIVYSKY